MTEEKAVALEDIELDKRCQARVALDRATVDAYADLLEDGVDMGALEVWEVDGVLYLVDGWHRLSAHVQIGKPFARVRIVGSSNEIEDATKAALSANHEHGLRRSRADKRRCVRLALEAELYEDLGSNRAMARDLGVSEGLVRKMLAERDAEQSGAADETEGAYKRTDDPTDPDLEAEDSEPGVFSDDGVQPERKPKKAKPSPLEAFKKNVERIGRDVPQFFEEGTEVHEATERLVRLVREHGAGGQSAAIRKTEVA